jgi:hypothetical protein
LSVAYAYRDRIRAGRRDGVAAQEAARSQCRAGLSALDNPHASEQELQTVFIELVKKDRKVQEAIFEDIYRELGPDGLSELFKAKSSKH